MGGIATGQKIIGSTYLQSQTIANTAATYAAGKVIGGAVQFTTAVRETGGSGSLLSLYLVDAEKLGKAMTIHFFNQAITAQTDGVALTLTDAERAATSIGFIRVVGADYETDANNSEAIIKNIILDFKAVGTDSIYAVVKAGESVTFAGTSSLTLKIAIKQD